MAEIDYPSAFEDFRIHGEYVANCSNWPCVEVSFGIKFTRNGTSSTLTWDTHDMSWSYDNGHFGYKITAAIAIDPADIYDPDWDTELWTILEKTHTGDDGNSWWSYADKYTPGPHDITCTKNKVKVAIYVKAADSCCNGGWPNYCFPVEDGHDWYYLGSKEFDVPPYIISYTKRYNTLGGSGNFPVETFSSADSYTTINSNAPYWPLTIKYFNGASTATPSTTQTQYRAFNNWKGDVVDTQSHSDIYAPGSRYYVKQDLSLVAQWGDASFAPVDIPDSYVTVTFNPMGGTVSPSSKQIAKSKLGYATSSGGSVVYNYGQNIVTSTNTNLYPKYGNASLSNNDIPTPTRSGYSFDGWYYDDQYTNPVTGSISTASNITIYAKWSALPIKQFDETWKGIGPYVWRFNGTTWEKVAHVYKFDGTQWIDLSQP